jgi:hypothetical protein
MRHQREGMGLLEYQPMPSLSDVALGGVMCTTVHSVIAQPQARTSDVVRQGRYSMELPSRVQNHTILGHSPPAGPSCWASPLAFNLIIWNLHTIHVTVQYLALRESKGIQERSASWVARLRRPSLRP